MSIFKIVRFVIGIILLFFVFYILTANTVPTTIKVFPFPAYTVTYPLSIILLMAFFIGVMMIGIYAGLESLKNNKRLRKLSKQNSLLEQEISNLRKEPLLDDPIDEGSGDGTDDDLASYDGPLDEETLNKIR